MYTKEAKSKFLAQAWGMLQAGKGLCDIADALPVHYVTLCRWLSHKLGEQTIKEYQTGVKARRAQIFRRLGYTTRETGRLLGVNHATIVNWLKREAWGNPIVLVRFDGTVTDTENGTIPVEKYGLVAWCDEREAMVTRTDNERMYFIRWADLIGNAIPIGSK